MKSQNNRGFTLIELVVAMVIFGLIIALTTPILIIQYQKWTAQAAAEQTVGQLNDIYSAAQLYAFTRGSQATDIVGTPTSLVDAGFLTSAPVPANNVSVFVWDATGAPTVIVKTTTNSTEICSKINELYAGMNADETPDTTVNANKNIQCFGTQIAQNATSGETLVAMITPTEANAAMAPITPNSVTATPVGHAVGGYTIAITVYK